MTEILINEDETLEELQPYGLKLIQKKEGFRFGMDSVLLADFADIKANDSVADFGTGSGVLPLGKILTGGGNNGEDGGEGVRYHNVFGTYSHGPVLPKNPELCDFILQTALSDRMELMPLNDQAELAAHDAMLKRLTQL